MSNRSRFEFNHDYVGEISDEREDFVEALLGFLRTKDKGILPLLAHFGLKYEGTRHHSEEWPKDGGGE